MPSFYNQKCIILEHKTFDQSNAEYFISFKTYLKKAETCINFFVSGKHPVEMVVYAFANVLKEDVTLFNLHHQHTSESDNLLANFYNRHCLILEICNIILLKERVSR